METPDPIVRPGDDGMGERLNVGNNDEAWNDRIAAAEAAYYIASRSLSSHLHLAANDQL